MRRSQHCFSMALLGLAISLAGCDSSTPEPMVDAGPAVLPCEYPAFSGDLGFGEVLPEFAWRGALHLDDTNADFSVRDFYCSEEYDGYSSMILMVSAGWCSACPAYINMLNQMAPSLEAQGVLVVYVEVETSAFEPATAADAAEFIDSCISPGEFESGLRIGDADKFGGEEIRNLVTQFPSAYFVRRSDMTIVADQAASIYVLDFGTLAGDPTAPWTPALPPFVANCEPTDEEPLEPNDTFETAGLIEPTSGEISGGICAEGSDFYEVTLEGPWRFDLYQDLFTMPEPDAHNVDLRLWGPSMERLGGSNIRGNHDWVDFEGPAFVEVYGEQSASGTYRVSLTAR